MKLTKLTGVLQAALISATIIIAQTQTQAASDSEVMVDALANFHFDQLGHPQIQSDSISPVLASADKPHKLLVVPVRFSDKTFDRFAGDPKQDEKNQDYFQKLLFAGGATTPEPATLSHYYQHQSRGLYNITGTIFPTVELDKPLHHYGRPIQNSDGTWRNDEHATQLVVDALKGAYASDPDFPWQDYDQWDPKDFDADGVRDEPDGYLDHFILIVSGKGQASCQGLYNLDEKLTVNAGPDAFKDLSANEQECADRIWPHRFSLNQDLGNGPLVDDKNNARGGIDIGNGLWVLDYNMQSEYTEVSTFIHEFGHSLDLPDVYARQTNNSTGSWEAMSATTSPEPQEMSTWARMVLGWMKPCVIYPSGEDSEKSGSIYLKTMNDWSGDIKISSTDGVCDSAMVILPPKFRDIELGPFSDGNGQFAAYSGQGNDMNRSLSRTFDFRKIHKGSPIVMGLDAWFVIEAEWDYLYVELAQENGEFERIMPTDKKDIKDKLSSMPSTKGHEGKGSVPGFTGRSGDLDGDGKVETASGCDPESKRVLAEDKVGSTVKDPCEEAQWVHSEFDLSAYAGKQVKIRFTYFTDMAAVEDGALLDNISIPAIKFSEDFESASLDQWEAKGFTMSGGNHHLAVPHYYLLEYRDPYEKFAAVKNYDAGLAKTGFNFFPDGDGISAINVNYRPGVVMWYYNGEYLWSQNEPSDLGPGRGYLLVVDSNPQEIEIPAVPQKYFVEEDGWTHWQFDDNAQDYLHKSYVGIMCFQRRPAYFSNDVLESDRARCQSGQKNGLPAMESLSWDGRPLLYGYTMINELLPGADRRARKGASTLFDLRVREGKTEYRLYDRVLRNYHSGDAPFSLDAFASGVEFYKGVEGKMQRQSSRAYPPVSEFTDKRPNRYLSPKLPFGGADIPEAGFSYKLVKPDAKSPAGSKVRIDYKWRKMKE